MRGRWPIVATIGGLAFAAGLAAHSGTAMFGLLAGAVAYACALLAPHVALGATAIATTAALAVAPIVGVALERLLPLLESLERFHAHHRILIWSAFGQRVEERPVLGHGFGAIDRVWTAPHPDGLPANRAVDWVIENIHSHDQPLQVWVELGGVGAILVGLVCAAALGRLRSLPRRRLAPRLAAFVACLAIALVGFGAWQAWWVATVAAALALFAADSSLAPAGDAS